jgi:hypothetical protein
MIAVIGTTQKRLWRIDGVNIRWAVQDNPWIETVTLFAGCHR